ncbi:hypothetical protein W02_42890 [Nitrospira sp. KM1]|uniref:DUF4011 domain-containing protein n=1 Tax=Nitrospira sp. KM1 TaxID=1936990 RepID=UPI0013A78EE3|nr:DUF4011 domain-containing protein [Nitrospira sp. KM1]BCA57149.1 hypothetical protein W02_42890 [Nitrospira sp. KM1]
MAERDSSPGSDDFAETVRRGIENFRSRLLDLSLANRLLNYKHSEKSRTQIRVIDEVPEILLAKLDQDKKLVFSWIDEPESDLRDENTPEFLRALEYARENNSIFQDQKKKLGRNPSARQLSRIERSLRDRVRKELGLPNRSEITLADRAKELGIDPSNDLPEITESLPRRHTDSKLQTLHYREHMEAKVAAIRDGDRTLLEDAGINALYCAFGFIEWYETPHSDTALYAPLLFYPVEIERTLQSGRYSYVLISRDGDVESNITLSELLKRNYDLELPQWNPDEELSKYFAKVRQVISSERKWKVRRWVTIGLFTFSKLVMYRDLDQTNWSPALHQHSRLQDLFLGKDSTGTISLAPEYPMDGADSTVKDVQLITDADSSQHSAVIDVIKGKSLVIQGPPGTGKSQTITNIVAAALHEGKTVLFVAEKMAALEVVKSRLDKFELGNFCLELHSGKTRKTRIIDSIKKRIEYEGPSHNPNQIRAARKACQESQNELLHYVNKMHMPVGETGFTVHNILRANCVRARQVEGFPIGLRRARINNPCQIEALERHRLMELAQDLDEKTSVANTFGGINQHPWRGLGNDSLHLFQFDEIRSSLLSWSTLIETLMEAIKVATLKTFWPIVSTTNGASAFGTCAKSLPDFPRDFDQSVFRQLRSYQDCEALEEVISNIQGLAHVRAQIDTITTEGDSILNTGSTSLATLIDEIAEEGLDRLRVQEIENLLQETEANLLPLEHAAKVADSLTQLFSISDASTQDLHHIVEAMSVLTGLPKTLLKYRQPDILEEDNLLVLVEALEEKKKLDEAANRLSKGINLKLVPSLPEVKAAYRTLKTAGAIQNLLTRECREARKLYKSISTQSGRPSRQEAIDGLIETFTYLEDLQTFTGDPRWQEAAGRFFLQERTPWEDLIRVARWGETVRGAIRASHLSLRSIRDVLLAGERETLESIYSIAESTAFESLQKVLGAVGNSPFSSLQTILTSKREYLAKLRQIIGKVRQLGLSTMSPIDNLRSLLTAIIEVETYLASLKQPSAMRFLSGSTNPTLDHAVRLRSNLQFATILERLKIPEAVWTRFTPTEGFDLITVLREHSQIVADHLALTLKVQDWLCTVLKIDEDLWTRSVSLRDSPLETLQEKALFAHAHFDSIQAYLDFLRVETRANSTPLLPVLKAMRESAIEYKGLAAAFECILFRSIAETLLDEDPKLNSHSGSNHDQLRKRFQKLDKQILELQREEIANKLLQRYVDPGVARGKASERTGLALLQHQIGLQKRHLPLRSLFRKAGQAIQSLKPCFLMSPMSVAQFLEAGGLQFDIIIMDEASQVRPEEAIGAIARGSQIVIVGDPMQLPPTTFFEKVDSDCVEDKESEEVVMSGGFESILDLTRSVFQPVRQLKWHYRSQHERLIAFSNSEFYDNSLIVFPSPHGSGPEFGVHLVDTNGTYDGGTNRAEAEAITNAAKEFTHQYPTRSLGIVAMNQAQRDLINEIMDNEVFANDPESAAYRENWDSTLEPFFVKNLENVQGDERDVIFISTVYGKDGTGNFYRRFGPVNGVNGHRRLNVLFTRAKQVVKVFTSMDPSLDWGPLEEMRRGVQAFKNYLDFARNGHTEFARATGREPDSEFEKWVIAHLREKGYKVVPQLGVAGYFIDIAVQHPDRLGSFILGIECDGATYHSARSVRDRDRLRQEILERLKWNIHRVWSTDWFRNPYAEIDKLVHNIEQLRTLNPS